MLANRVDNSMNKQQINLQIAQYEYPDSKISIDENGELAIFIKGVRGWITKEYCENWNDLMPLILRYCGWFKINSVDAVIGLPKSMTVFAMIGHDGTPEGKQLALAKCLLEAMKAEAEKDNE